MAWDRRAQLKFLQPAFRPQTFSVCRYQRQLRREPLQTKVRVSQGRRASTRLCHSEAHACAAQAATAGVLAVLSDVLAQKLAGSRTVNWRRASAVGVSVR